MDDLTGHDAFDKVLEAAMDAHHNARQATERQSDAEMRAQQAERETVSLQGKVHRLEQEAKDAMPKLAELWQAASDMALITADGNPYTVNKRTQRLRDALESTAGYCDDIPF
jgi:hypothetical protein